MFLETPPIDMSQLSSLKLFAAQRHKTQYHAYCITTKNAFDNELVFPGKTFDILTAEKGAPFQKILCQHHHPEVTKQVTDSHGRKIKGVKYEKGKDADLFTEGTKDYKVFQHYLENTWIHKEERDFEFSSEYFDITDDESKESLMNALRANISKAKNVGVDTYLIYFTGPSFFPSGNWLVADRIDKKNEKPENN